MAVDIGGTKLAVAVVDAAGEIRHRVKIPTAKDSTRKSIDQIVETVRHIVPAAGISWDQIAAAGLAVPGIYFADTGAVWAPNLPGWDHLPLREELESQLRARIVIDSDRAAYVLGEQWLGIAQGLSDVVFLAVGTGIGAGIISGGKLCRGAGDIAGSVGWFALNPEKQERYRQSGCWESEAAGPALARRDVIGSEESARARMARS